jgi:short-subunit dehydrogenase
MSPKALITGGGGAIAEELALRLDARGYRLVLVDINRARMEAVAGRLKGKPQLVDADLSSLQGIMALCEIIRREHANLDLLVNNAGYIEPGDITDLEAATVERHITINLTAPMLLSQVAAGAMKARKRGDILSIISMGGILALRGSASYAASKFGLRGFQTSIKAELAPHGVRVMGVFPSGVDTPMLRKEALHPSGSPLNFVGHVLSAGEVADSCLRALDSGRLETYVPYGDSITSRLVGFFPWLLQRIEPVFARAGERGRARYIASRGLKADGGASSDPR